MRRCLFGLGLLWPLFLGCSGENVVAGQEKTKAEQLESALATWCPSTCERLRACPASAGCECSVGDDCGSCVGIDEGCERQCAAAFEPYTNAGERCAAVGQRIKTCIDGLTCENLGGEDPCRASNAEMAACPDPNDVDDNPPMIGDNPTAGTGGTGAIAAGGANPVSCSDSTASAGASPQTNGPKVTCEEGRAGCSNGHIYSWICSQDSQGQRACACLVDSLASASFVPASSECPTLVEVNAGCAWVLTH